MADYTPRQKQRYNDVIVQASNGEYRQFYDKGRIVSKNANGEMTIAGIVFDITDIDIAKIAKFSGKKLHKRADPTKKK